MTNNQRKKLLPFVVGSQHCEVDYDYDFDQPRHYQIINEYNFTYEGGSFTIYPDGSFFKEPDKTDAQLDKIFLGIATEHLREFYLLLKDLAEKQKSLSEFEEEAQK